MTRRRKGLLGGLALLLAALVLLGAWPMAPLPPPPESSRVLDRDGLLIAERAGPGSSPGQPVEALPEVLAQALVAAEDHRFYRHPGVDPIAILRAARRNAREDAIVEGGSTLTQQLVRLCWQRPPGYRGKAWEAAQALRLELRLSKEQILVEYANRVYFGSGASGVEAASRVYLDKGPERLSAAEAALLAALPKAPSRLDPWEHPQAAREARDRVLDRMEALDFLDPEAATLARSQPLGLREAAPWDHAPHFVRRVVGPGDVHTSLDLALQEEVEALVAQQLDRLQGRATQVAVLVVELSTGEPLAWVGSAGWSTEAGQVDGVTARRSPGSALKPFLYQLALEQGMSLASVVADLPGSWPTTHGAYTPSNYDGRFHGPLRLRRALATSRNLPAARLVEEVGVATFHRRLQDLGLSTLDQRPDHYGLALALGDGEVRLDELVAAYATLGRLGRTPEGRQIGDPAAAWLILDALDDPDARAPVFGVDSILEPAFPLAAKTGTSVGWRDNWAVGVTPEVVVGVWVGNFDGRPMQEVSGVTGAGPLLRAVAEAAHTGRVKELRPPPELVSGPVCPLSGLRKGPHCPGALREHFVPGTEPTQVCDWHVAIEVDAQGALATGCPDSQPRAAVDWPAAYVAWAEETGQPRWPDQDRSCTPLERPTEAPGILWPEDGAVFYLDADRSPEHQALTLRASVRGAERVLWRVDGAPIGEVGSPYSLRWVPTPGPHRLSLELDGAELDHRNIHVGGGQ